VLGGGGVTGIGWESGLIAGLAEAGVDLRDADVIIGTSAGATVAAQLGSGRPIEQLYEAQLEEPSGERAAAVGLTATLRLVMAGLSSRKESVALARVGRMAMRARTVEVAQRRAVIESRLPTRQWPDRPKLRLTAVDADSGQLQVFDADSGVDLVDAVAASCAVPFVWPPVPISGHRYIDGGVRSPTNADLVGGAERIVVLAPMVLAMRRTSRPGAQLAALDPSVRHVLVTPSARARRDMGRNPLDPACRAPAARAGRAQASAVIDEVRDVWNR
jgi:NTE family protein